MKTLLLAVVTLTLLGSCGMKVPLTKAIKQEYNLDEAALRKVQFYVSSEIILQQESKKGSAGTTSDGTLVSTSANEKSRLIILPRTKCVFEEYVDSNTIVIRFENGATRTISFATRPNMENGKYYFLAEWEQGKGGRIQYDNQVYYATPSSASAYIMVKVKRSQRTKRKDRRVKGMKV